MVFISNVGLVESFFEALAETKLLEPVTSAIGVALAPLANVDGRPELELELDDDGGRLDDLFEVCAGALLRSCRCCC